ncbi:hypothetical protein SCHPADRAFT_753814 [Schizopora paradoxa]|uniref:Uncharacterized protein n=1 Tax=Schizopora paradoxa TaxID=27342 RepID=A0A0H2QZQ0_9AGAM|nr:hypothetical protein SCHPADRAFT_753814 [Schizopora paradoxa]
MRVAPRGLVLCTDKHSAEGVRRRKRDCRWYLRVQSAGGAGKQLPLPSPIFISMRASSPIRLHGLQQLQQPRTLHSHPPDRRKYPLHEQLTWIELKRAARILYCVRPLPAFIRRPITQALWSAVVNSLTNDVGMDRRRASVVLAPLRFYQYLCSPTAHSCATTVDLDDMNGRRGERDHCLRFEERCWQDAPSTQPIYLGTTTCLAAIDSGRRLLLPIGTRPPQHEMLTLRELRLSKGGGACFSPVSSCSQMPSSLVSGC